MLRRLFLALMLLPALAAADMTVVGEGRGSYSLGLHAQVLEDPTAALGIEQVAGEAMAGRFRSLGREHTNFGFTRAALWFRVTVDFRAGQGRTWHLVEGHPILDEITFYMPDGSDGWSATTLGDLLPFAERPYRLREFVLPVPEQVVASAAPVTFYLRVAGQGALNVGLELLDQQALAERVSRQQWGFGLFYGALGLLFFYNLFLYLSARERSQLYYIVWLGGFTMLFASLNGFGLQYLWPQLPAINGWFPVFTCVAVWGALQFTREFLDIAASNPRLDAVFRIMLVGVGVVLVLGFLLPKHWMYILGNGLPVLFAVVMLAAGVLRLRQGYRPARLFVIGWGVLLVGAILLPLAMLGLLPVNTLTNYSPQFGAVLQGMLLSLALGERVKLLKVDNERIQRESHARLEQMFDQLKSLDADKSRFLHYLSHELNTPLNWMSAARQADRGAVDPELRAAMSAVEAGQQRMIDLVGTVLRYFDIVGEDPAGVARVPVAPMWLVDDLLREFAGEINARKLQVRNRVPADLVVLASEQRLRRVLAILIDNAIQFSAEGQEVEIAGTASGALATLVVRDQGRGIDPEHLGRLFEPFFMVGSHHREGGFGLSLAMARMLLQHMGGEIRVHSAGRGTGATFDISLPAASAAPRPEAPQSPAG